MKNIAEKENLPKNKWASAALPSVGSIVEGKVVARDRSALFVDLGTKGTGIIYGKEFYLAKDTIKNLKIGDTVSGKVIEAENEDGYRELSLKDASQEISWQKIKTIKDKEEIINVKIKGVNKGGLLASVNNIPAFLPVSQLSPENYPRVRDANKQAILKELQKFIGKTLEVKILDVSSAEEKLILSEKAKTEEAIKEFLKKYRKGDVIEGKITGLADFGVFIKFPLTAGTGKEADKQTEENQLPENESPENKEIEGLIHISELDWQLIQNPAEIVKVGDIVKAQIINIEGAQVFLSLKSLSPNPWEEIEKKYKKGDVIKGKVAALNPFGVFIEVAPKIRGLCHISEFKNEQKMKEQLLSGQEYQFEITSFEPKEYKMGLKPTDVGS